MKSKSKNESFLKILKDYILNIIGLIQYRLAIRKSIFQCIFVGEKPQDELHNTVILYREKGLQKNIGISIKSLLANRALLEKFHQRDAMRFGIIAMGDTLFRESEGTIQQRFDEIKNKMLDAALTGGFCYQTDCYPCKIAGRKKNSRENYETIILYTHGKRDVFEIRIRELLENDALLSKFHQITAVKLGAIAMGDALFRNNQKPTKEHYDEIKQIIFSRRS